MEMRVFPSVEFFVLGRHGRSSGADASRRISAGNAWEKYANLSEIWAAACIRMSIPGNCRPRFRFVMNACSANGTAA